MSSRLLFLLPYRGKRRRKNKRRLLHHNTYPRGDQKRGSSPTIRRTIRNFLCTRLQHSTPRNGRRPYPIIRLNVRQPQTRHARVSQTIRLLRLPNGAPNRTSRVNLTNVMTHRVKPTKRRPHQKHRIRSNTTTYHIRPTRHGTRRPHRNFRIRPSRFLFPNIINLRVTTTRTGTHIISGSVGNLPLRLLRGTLTILFLYGVNERSTTKHTRFYNRHFRPINTTNNRSRPTTRLYVTTYGLLPSTKTYTDSPSNLLRNSFPFSSHPRDKSFLCLLPLFWRDLATFSVRFSWAVGEISKAPTTSQALS